MLPVYVCIYLQEACATVWEHRMSNEYDAVRMQLYGLYKVAKEGKCQEPKPKPDTVSEQCPDPYFLPGVATGM